MRVEKSVSRRTVGIGCLPPEVTGFWFDNTILVPSVTGWNYIVWASILEFR